MGVPIVHLGDGLNFSCTAEMDTFFATMDHASKAGLPWVMAPGNHDGYFFGNEAEAGSWKKSCNLGGEPVNHEAFLSRYLKVIASQFDVSPLGPTSGLWQRPAGQAAKASMGCDPPGTTKSDFLDGVAWHLDKAAHWRSYVVQLVNLSLRTNEATAYGLLLDTSEYDDPPVLIPNTARGVYDAGETGNVRDDQIEDARKLLEAHFPKSGPKPLLVLMGHHPYGTIAPSGRARIDKLFKDFPVVIYISAHTHTAQYFVNGEDKSTWLELNLGSILDWAPEFRFLSLNQSADKTKLELKTPQQKVLSLWKKQTDVTPFFDSKWEAKPGEQRYYLSFLDVGKLCLAPTDLLCSAPMQNELMKTELAEIKFSISTFPTTSSKAWPRDPTSGAKLETDAAVIGAIDSAMRDKAPLDERVTLAKDLQAFDEDREAGDAPGATAKGRRHHDYRLWQAMWASMRMNTRTRIPDSDQGFFVFPTEAR